jgi:hypothetical protein
VPTDPKAATQEQGVKEIESSQDGPSNLPSNAGEPRDNRDFADHPNSR